VVEFAVLAFGRGPAFSSIEFVERWVYFLATRSSLRLQLLPPFTTSPVPASGLFLCCQLVHGDDCELMDGFDSILVVMVDDEVLLF
jgi:hypothetical protein